MEELAVERTVLRPGEIELTLRNTGPDPVSVAQVAVADAFVTFTEPSPTARSAASTSQTLTLDYPWQEGSPVRDLHPHLDREPRSTTRSTSRSRRPRPAPSFYGLMTVLGTYVGVIPVLLGMLFMPLLRRVTQRRG